MDCLLIIFRLVAQSDNIVYVYKLGTTWKEKKVICNKFPQPTAVTVMVWLSVGPIIIGLLSTVDGSSELKQLTIVPLYRIRRW